LQQQESEDENIAIQQKIYARLDKIVQSSALVECINSIIRPYLNTGTNQVNQKFLNLIMHYHNYRRYRDGVRKNKTPIALQFLHFQGHSCTYPALRKARSAGIKPSKYRAYRGFYALLHF